MTPKIRATTRCGVPVGYSRVETEHVAGDELSADAGRIPTSATSGAMGGRACISA